MFHWFLSLLLLTYVWRVQDIFPILGKLQLLSLATVGALGFSIVAGNFSYLADRGRHSVYKLAIFLLILAILSVPAGIFDGNSFRFLTEDHIKTVLFMTLIVTGLKSVGQVRKFASIQVLGAFIYCGVVVMRARMVNGRMIGVAYYDANDIGMLCVCILPIAVTMLRKGTPNHLRMLGLATLPVLLLALAKTGSRGGFLGLIAVGIFMLMRFDSFTKGARMATVITALLGLSIFGGDQYWALMKTMLNPSEDYNMKEETGRKEVWKRGMGYMIRRPILGVGAANFYVAEGTLSEIAKRQEFGKGLKWSTAHNSFVQIGAELGVFGLIAFILMLRAAYKSTVPPSRPANFRNEQLQATDALGRALGCAMVGFLVTGFFLSQGYGALLYTLLGMIVAYDFARRAEAAQLVTAGDAPATQQTSRVPLGRGGLIVGNQFNGIRGAGQLRPIDRIAFNRSL